MQEKGRKKNGSLPNGGRGTAWGGGWSCCKRSRYIRYLSSERIKNKKSRSSSSTITRLWTRRRRRRWASSVGGATDSNHGQARTHCERVKKERRKKKMLCLDMLSDKGGGDEGSGIYKQCTDAWLIKIIESRGGKGESAEKGRL